MSIKIIDPQGWDFQDSVYSVIKYSSRGILGSDASCLVKRASEEFLHLARNIKIAADQLPIHLIAMGATEAYGPNRNADGYKEGMLINRHHTFVKNAKPYKNHKNKDPQRGYGEVKLSFYNKPMRRVELLVALSKNEKAAERVGGLVDEDVINKAESGKDIPWSMACKIAHDVCDVCGNKAPSRNEYCESEAEGGTCPGFGCKTGLARTLSNGQIQHVDNPEPLTFFDISFLTGRPADRTAYGAVADYLKAASATHVVGGAEMAELWNLGEPDWLDDSLPGAARDQLKLAETLRNEEAHFLAIGKQAAAGNLAAFGNPGARVDVSKLGEPGSVQSLNYLAALSRYKIALPLSDFLRWLCQDSTKAANFEPHVRQRLPMIYTELGSRLAAYAADNPYLHTDRQPSDAQLRWAAKYAEDLSLDKSAVAKRARLAVIRGGEPTHQLVNRTKLAGLNVLAAGLAEQYALYKLAFLAAQREEVPLTAGFIVSQNYAC